MLIPSAYTLQYHPEQCNRKAEYGCTNWNANTVREILSRQEYLGHTVLRKTIGTNFKTDERRFATDEERLVFENTHEPIVDSELWEQAHRRLKHTTRRIKEGTHQEECLLPGLVYCSDCGSKMSYQTNYYKSGEPYHSFRCSSYGNRTVNCTIHHISDKVLYQLSANKELFADVMKTRNEKHCQICGKAFVPKSKNQRYYTECAKVQKRKKQPSANGKNERLRHAFKVWYSACYKDFQELNTARSYLNILALNFKVNKHDKVERRLSFE